MSVAIVYDFIFFLSEKLFLRNSKCFVMMSYFSSLFLVSVNDFLASFSSVS